jgi:hypothetical protein
MGDARFVVRTFHCPRCDSIYDYPTMAGPQLDTERICGRCWHREMEESDDRPLDSYPRSG